MATRPLRGKRRASNLALPFVVTAAAACTVRPAPEEPKPQEAPAGRPSVKGEAPTARGNTANQGNMTTISNPPPPTKPPEMTTNPPPPSALPQAPTSGGSMYVADDGACMWVESVTCPPKTMCNPPPPRQVQCPEDKGGEK